MQLSSCSHLNAALQPPSGTLHCWYRAVCQRLVFPVSDKYAHTRADFLHCSVCPSDKRMKCQALLMCCTDCNMFCCLNHMPSHLRDNKHPFAMSLETGHLYCFWCADFVYSQCIEFLRITYLNTCRQRLGMKRLDISITSDDLMNWKRRRPLEVRGLYNMGNTCYMNCVVQALVHTPLLRKTFLAGNHSTARGSPATCMQQRGQCFHCELVKVVESMNSSDDSPVACPQLLCLLWRLAPHLAGYRQHDAQEFFLAAHDLMHRHYQGPSHKMSDACPCVMHSVFGGVVRSAAHCGACLHKWVSGEGSFVDVQLNVPEFAKKTSMHLRECLMDLSRDEVISDYSCPRCQTKPIVRQTKFSHLPSVLVLHLKRFKLSPNGMADSTKVSTEVRFDFDLDMTDFMSRSSTRIPPDEPASKAALQRIHSSYSLFAIVSHSGSMQVGHYVSYVRTYGDTWWKCDDQMVHRVDTATVTNVEAYMLFYQMKSLR